MIRSLNSSRCRAAIGAAAILLAGAAPGFASVDIGESESPFAESFAHFSPLVLAESPSESDALALLGLAAPLDHAAALGLKADEEKKAPAEDGELFKHWDSQIELGVNGSSGNSENFNIRAGFISKRVTDRNETLFGVLYTYATSDGTSTRNRFEAALRNDFLLAPDSRWSLFAQGKFEYDEFQDWKYRTQLFGGVGYAFIKDDVFLLRGRLGAGATKEFGSSRNEFIPEGLVGVDFDWKITKATRYFALGEFYPSFENSSDYRLLGKTGLEIMVDPELKLSLKMGVEDRYNSNPGGDRKKNDVDYFIALGLAF